MSEQQAFRKGAAYALRYVVDELGLDITDSSIWADMIDEEN